MSTLLIPFVVVVIAIALALSLRKSAPSSAGSKPLLPLLVKSVLVTLIGLAFTVVIPLIGADILRKPVWETIVRFYTHTWVMSFMFLALLVAIDSAWTESKGGHAHGHEPVTVGSSLYAAFVVAASIGGVVILACLIGLYDGSTELVEQRLVESKLGPTLVLVAIAYRFHQKHPAVLIAERCLEGLAYILGIFYGLGGYPSGFWAASSTRGLGQVFKAVLDWFAPVGLG